MRGLNAVDVSLAELQRYLRHWVQISASITGNSCRIFVTIVHHITFSALALLVGTHLIQTCFTFLVPAYPGVMVLLCVISCSI